MITVTAHGFLAEKPQLEVFGQNRQKAEFDVLWNRRQNVGGEWKTVWERATFIAWGEDAERVASTLEKGSEVSCTGLQETSEWIDRATGAKRYRVRYKLTAWTKQYRPSNRVERDGAASEQSSGQQDSRYAARRPSADRNESQRQAEPRGERYAAQPMRSVERHSYGDHQESQGYGAHSEPNFIEM